VAGDVVDLERSASADGPAAITGVRPRKSVLARRSAGERDLHRAQPIVANVDQVVVVTAAREPDPNPRMLDRFLVIAAANGLPAVIVVNKVDLDQGAAERLGARFGPAGYRIVATSVRTGMLGGLGGILEGRASVLAGPSGVGKSSLLNALYPGLALRTGGVSERFGSGRHTTRAAVLVPLDARGGFVADTPGLREVGTWALDPNALAACFPEFRPFLDRCRFDNCRHMAEPDCAVREAADAGAFDADRLASYQRLYEEVNVPAWSSGRSRPH